MATTASSSEPSNRNPMPERHGEHHEERDDVSDKVADVRPISTAERDMGNERRRSMRPLPRSSARPMLVNAEPNTSDWLKMPGIKYCS